MIREVTAKRYAEAAYLVARESGKQDEWSRGLNVLASLLNDPNARVLLENVRVPMRDKLTLIEEALDGQDPMVLNLARLILRRGRISLAPQIAEAFQELLDEARGITHAVVTTAVPLTDDEAKAIAGKLREITGREVLVQTQVDERILGGLVARIGDKVIDGSTKSRLEALKRQLEGAGAGARR